MRHLRKYTVLLLLLFILPVRSQEQNTVRLQWNRVPGALEYQLEIRPQSGGSVLRQTSNTTSIELGLEPGIYRVRILPVNKFGRPEENASWQQLTVARLAAPSIDGVSPNYFSENDERIEFTLSGNHFRTDTQFYIERNGRRLTPDRVRFENQGRVTLLFNRGSITPGTYRIVALDRVGQRERLDYPIAVGLQALTERNAQYPDRRQTREAAAFFNGVASNNQQAVRSLLQSSFNPNIADSNGFYAVHYAAYLGHLDMLKLLREYGAALDARDKGGAQPVHHAAYKNREEIVRYLVGFGYNSPNALTFNRYAPLDRAALKGNTAIMQYLISKGANINHTFSNGESALHMAVYSGNNEAVRILAENGAAVNHQENRGFSPLHYAAFYSHARITSYLLQNGADKTLRSQNGESALDITRRSRRPNSEIIQLLSSQEAQ